jgi:hypothetical protein
MWEMDSLNLEMDESSESEHMESDDGAVELDEMERADGMSRGREFVRTSGGSPKKKESAACWESEKEREPLERCSTSCWSR